METGKALEIVHGMATRLFEHYGEFHPAGVDSKEVKTALNTVKDLIVNNFEEDDETDLEPKGEPMTDERQLERWVAGDSVHNSETDECCPDFSCCQPDLMWPVEDRKKFAEAYINEDSETTHLMRMDALGALVKSLDEKVHIAGENDGY